MMETFLVNIPTHPSIVCQIGNERLCVFVDAVFRWPLPFQRTEIGIVAPCEDPDTGDVSWQVVRVI